MVDVELKGRGYTEPRVTITAADDGVLIRGDCAQHDESWVELLIPLATLAELLCACMVQRADSSAHAVRFACDLAARYSK
jgi:hypothetical protein